jgi:iron(III) transport system permease protein
MSRPASIALGSSSVVKGTRISPSAMLWPLIAAVLAFMVLLPLAWLVWISFQSDTTDQLTLGNYIDAFQSRTSLIAILNSLLLALGVATGATIAGTIMAWLITRTDMPFRGLVRALILASFVTPSFMGAIAWILLASPNAGWLNQMWVAVSGSDTPLFNIFSLGGAMFVMAIYAISYPFSLVAATLDQAPSEYENAARTLGAGLSRITWSITLPLAAPAIISGFILSFLEAIASFGVAAFILIPARRPVITIELLSLFSEFPPRLGQAAAYGIPLLAVTAVLLTIQRRLLARRSFTLITGKGGLFRRVALGVWRWPAFALAMVPPILSVLLPYAAMLLVSLSVAWGKGPFAPGNLSFQWYHKVFFDTVSARNSLGHSLVYCSVAMFGTLSVDLENAGRILGASRIAVLRVITAPLLRGALLSSWMLVFISSFRELSTVIFLFVGGTAVITTQIYDFSSSGYYESVCVLGIVMMLVVFSATLAVYGLFGAPLNRLQSSEVPN